MLPLILGLLMQGGAPTMQAPTYHETLRPQFHFTPQTGWTNDPNGLVYFKGEYHLFFQHNPFGTEWGNMTWGHAVSKDLVHWSQLPSAIEPDALGTIFSGSAVVDHANTSGFGQSGKPALVCIYTAAGGTNEASKGQPFTQCLAYSLDGRTSTKFSGNPVLGHIAGENRDPKVLWHAPSKRWIMALYLEGDRYALFSSPDLRVWEKLCDVPMPGCGECPDFFEMKVGGLGDEGTKGRRDGGFDDWGIPSTNPESQDTSHGSRATGHGSRWVFWAANGRYRIGDFDGKTYKPETDVLQADFGPNSYAAQTYSDAPSGRRLQISWMQGGKYPGMPFNQQMSFPRELSLRQTADGPRLCMAPGREIEKIRGRHWSKRNMVFGTGITKLPGEGDLLELRLSCRALPYGQYTFAYRGASVAICFNDRVIRCMGKEAPIPKLDGPMDLTLLFDRASVEVFAFGGRVTMAGCYLPDPTQRELTMTLDRFVASRENNGCLDDLDVWELQGIWP